MVKSYNLPDISARYNMYSAGLLSALSNTNRDWKLVAFNVHSLNTLLTSRYTIPVSDELFKDRTHIQQTRTCQFCIEKNFKTIVDDEGNHSKEYFETQSKIPVKEIRLYEEYLTGVLSVLSNWGGAKKVIYKWQKPFVPFLMSTGSGCRLIVSPLRTFIDPICNGCSPITKGETQNDPTDVKEFVKSFAERFNDGNVIRAAVKIKLIQQGINCFSPRIVQAVRYIEKMQKEKLISIDAIAQALEVTPTKTTLYPEVKA